MATVGVLMALMARERTGKGQLVDVAMMDGVAAWMLGYYGSCLLTNAAVRRGEERINGGMASYSVYRTRDDKYISVGAIEAKFWAAFCGIIGKPDLVADHYGPPARQREMMGIIGDVIATRTRAEWIEMFRGKDVCVEPVNDIEEAVENPQLLHRQMIIETDLPGEGKVKQVGFPIKLSDTPGSVRTPVAGVGQHTSTILRQLGFSQVQLEELAKTGVINPPG